MQTKSIPQTTPFEYQNTQYGFRFALPESWRGYSIVSDTWEGFNSDSSTVAETGPMISIRHPKWTAETPRQDIPIMIFTTPEWGSLSQEKFHIGAAPIGPRELGRNASYVFALPARYNFAFPIGYEEVDHILQGHPCRDSEKEPPAKGQRCFQLRKARRTTTKRAKSKRNNNFPFPNEQREKTLSPEFTSPCRLSDCSNGNPSCARTPR